MTTPTLKFTKKPVTIEAYQLPTPPADGTTNEAHENAVWAFLGWCSKVGFEPVPGSEDGSVVITTLEGLMPASPGDWIIKGVKGEFYPCKPDIFEATYSPALAAQPELPEPVAAQSKFIDGNEWGWCSIEHHYLVQEHPYAWPAYETRLLYAEQVFAKQEPLSEIALAHQTSLFYPPDEMIASGIYMQAWRDAEAHHHIGDKA